jgi:hypothetical protein
VSDLLEGSDAAHETAAAAAVIVSDFTRAGDIDPGVALPLRLGDVWIDRAKVHEPAPLGRVWIADLLPVDAEPATVVFEDASQKRARLPVGEFRRRFQFRSR